MIRLIEGKYPNYKQLIPQNLSEFIEVDRESLLHSLKRVSLLSNQKSKGVTLTFSKNKMEITSNNPDMGTAKEELDVNYAGREMKIGFNARYVLEVLNSMNEDKVDLELKDQNSPGILRPKGDSSYTCVIMPMRI
jgi:DNA polymerase-3 subunit beta